MKLTNIKNCNRCGGDHDGLVAAKFKHPFAPPECAPIAWTHWATCPTTGDPILVMVKDDKKDYDRMLSGQEHFEAALPVVYQVFKERRHALTVADERSAPSEADELDAFKSTVREFFGKWKPTP